MLLLSSVIMCNTIPRPKNIKTPKRVGRGAAHRGRKSGRGSGGHKVRTGSHGQMCEGGQFPSYLRIRKKGFFKNKKKLFLIKTSDINKIAVKYNTNHVSIDMLKKYYNNKIKCISEAKVLFDQNIKCTFEKMNSSSKAQKYIK